MVAQAEAGEARRAAATTDGYASTGSGRWFDRILPLFNHGPSLQFLDEDATFCLLVVGDEAVADLLTHFLERPWHRRPATSALS